MLNAIFAVANESLFNAAAVNALVVIMLHALLLLVFKLMLVRCLCTLMELSTSVKASISGVVSTDQKDRRMPIATHLRRMSWLGIMPRILRRVMLFRLCILVVMFLQVLSLKTCQEKCAFLSMLFQEGKFSI